MRRLSVFFILCLGFVACSSEKSGKAAVDPFATPQSFCTKWAEAACNATVVDKCSGGGSDVDACVQSQSTFCLTALPANYDSENAKACVESVKNAFKDAKLTADEVKVVRNFAEPCNALSLGPIPAGGTCAQRSDCNTLEDYDCIIRPGETTGTCQIPIAVSGGDPCTNPEQICPDTHYCDGNNCLTRVAAGGACDETKPCGQAFRCQDVNGNLTCVAKGAAASNCTEDSECSSGVCAFGIGGSIGKCVNELELGVTVSLCEDLS